MPDHFYECCVNLIFSMALILPVLLRSSSEVSLSLSLDFKTHNLKAINI